MLIDLVWKCLRKGITYYACFLIVAGLGGGIPVYTFIGSLALVLVGASKLCDVAIDRSLRRERRARELTRIHTVCNVALESNPLFQGGTHHGS